MALVDQPTLQGWPTWNSCADVMDCYNCTTGISGCHWCPVAGQPGAGTCNAYGSLSGCVIGASCASPSDCIRTSAEFKGYEAPPAKAVMVFIVIALVLMAAFVCCLWCCFAVWDRRRLKALKQRIEARRGQTNSDAASSSQQQRGLQLSSLPVSSAFRGSSSSSVQSGGTTVTSAIPGASVAVSTKKKRGGAGGAELRENLLESKKSSSDDPEMGAAGSGSSSNARRYAVRLNDQGVAEVALVGPSDSSSSASQSSSSAPLPFPPPLPPLARKEALLRSCAKCGTVSALLAVFVALLVVCLMFPHMPAYSMCNKDIQWGSILTNMQRLQAAVDVDLHVAVWNPNRWTLRLRRVDARILYHSDIVGTGGKSDLTFPSGSLSDFLLTVKFNPSLPSAANMLRDHLKGQLLLDVLFDIDAAVLIGNFKHPVLAVNTSYVMEHLDAEGAVERQYCKCVNPDVNALPPPSHSALHADSSSAMETEHFSLMANSETIATIVPHIGARVQPQTVLRPRINVRTTFTTNVDEFSSPPSLRFT